MAGFRGLSDKERAAYLVLLEWFEHFRMCFDLNAHREAATAFWRTMVMKEGVEREPWQLEQWSAAIKWSRKRLRLTRSVEQGGGG